MTVFHPPSVVGENDSSDFDMYDDTEKHIVSIKWIGLMFLTKIKKTSPS